MTVSEFINKVGFKVDEASVKNVNNTISSIKGTATKLLGFIGIGISLKNLRDISEEFNGINDSITYTFRSLDNIKGVQKDILSAANDSKTSYSNMTKAVNQLYERNKDLFPVDDAIQFVKLNQQLLQTTGKSEAEASALQGTASRLFQGSIVSSSVLTRMMKVSPAYVNALADSLGISTEKFLEQAKAGKITTKQLKDSFMASADSIQKGFDGLDFSISDAMLNIRNKWGFWVDDLNSTLKITETIAKTMVKGFDVVMTSLNKVRTATDWLSEKLGGTENVLKLLAITGGGLLATLKYKKILGFITTAITGIKTIVKVFSEISTKAKIFSAVLIVIALILDDIINFMKGNDSVIGYAFEKAGIDAEEMRDKIKNIVKNLKKIFSGIGKAIKGAIQPVLNWLKKKFQDVFGDDVFEGLGNGLAGVINFIERITGKLAKNNGAQEFSGKFIAGIGGISAAIIVIKKVVRTIKSIKSAFNKVKTSLTVAKIVFGSLSPKILIIVAVIAALIAIGILLYKNWDKIIAKAKELASKVKGKFEEIKSSIKEKVDNIKDKFTELKVKLSTILNGIKTKFTNVWNSIKNFFVSIWTAMSSKVSNIIGKIKTTVSNLGNGIKTTVSKIKTNIVSGFQSAINWVKGLPSQAITWGKDIVTSIAKGIKNSISKVTGAVKEVAKKIKSFLHFSEPDEGPLSDFHTYMPDMIDSLSKGIKGGKGKVKNAVNELATNMSAISNVKAVSPRTAKSLAGGSSSSKNIVQNVNYHNEFNGDSAIQEKASKTMKKSSKDVTDELARALKYTG